MLSSKDSSGVIGGALRTIKSKLSCCCSSASLAPSSTLPHEASESPFSGMKNRDNFICTCNPPSPTLSIGSKHSMSTDNFLSTQTRKSLKVTDDDDTASSVHSAKEEEQASEDLSTPRSIHPFLAPVREEIDLSPEIVPSSHRVLTQSQTIAMSYGFVPCTPGTAWGESQPSDSLPTLPTFTPTSAQPIAQQNPEVQQTCGMNWSAICDTICDALCDIDVTNTNDQMELNFLMSLLGFSGSFLINWANNGELSMFEGTDHIINILQSIVHSK